MLEILDSKLTSLYGAIGLSVLPLVGQSPKYNLLLMAYILDRISVHPIQKLEIAQVLQTKATCQSGKFRQQPIDRACLNITNSCIQFRGEPLRNLPLAKNT